MKIDFEKFSLNLILPETNREETQIPLLFLHGFTGSAKDWVEIFPMLNNKVYPLAIDIIGHGESDSPDNTEFYTSKSISNQINSVLEKFNYEEILLCGYSMGGRIAISFTAHFPEKVKGLVLESSTFGIENKEERKFRKENDLELAAFILENPIEKFIDQWLNIPLFESQKKLPDKIKDEIRIKKLSNNNIGLANSLKGFSTGSMPYFINEFKDFKFPVLLLSGEYDNKFTELNRKFNTILNNSIHYIISSAGHNIHLENKKDFVKVVNQFIDKILS